MILDLQTYFNGDMKESFHHKNILHATHTHTIRFFSPIRATQVPFGDLLNAVRHAKSKICIVQLLCGYIHLFYHASCPFVPYAMLPASPRKSAWAASCSVQIPTFFILRFLTVRSSRTSRAKASYI